VKKVTKLTKKYYILEDGTKVNHPKGFFDKVELPSIEEFQAFLDHIQVDCDEAKLPSLAYDEIDDLISVLSNELYEDIEKPFQDEEQELTILAYQKIVNHFSLEDNEQTKMHFDNALESTYDTDGFVDIFSRLRCSRTLEEPEKIQNEHLKSAIEELMWSLLISLDNGED